MAVAERKVLDANELVGSARWHVHQVRIDGNAEIIEMTSESYRASSFLDNRIKLPKDPVGHTVRFEDLFPLFGNASGLATGYIFHISHVGSTLLARLVGEAPGVLSLREPMLLRWLAEIRRDVRQPESRFEWNGYVARLNTAVGLLGRPMPSEPKVIVKATSFASNLAEDILGLQPNARATAVYCGFETFAANVLNGKGGWQDMLAQAPHRMVRLHRVLGRQPWNLASMSSGEVVALNWLAEVFTLGRADARRPGQMTWLNFDRFLEDVESAVPAFLANFGIAADAAVLDRIHAGGVLKSYSKNPGVPYTAEDRQKVLRAVGESQAAEIAKGKTWLARAMSEHREFNNLDRFFDGAAG